MRTILLMVCALVLAACGSESEPPFQCADPCPGATEVATLQDGRLWCLKVYGASGHICGLAFDQPATADQCSSTAAAWTENWPALCQ